MDNIFETVFQKYQDASQRWEKYFVIPSYPNYILKPLLPFLEYTFFELQKYLKTFEHVKNYIFSNESLENMIYADLSVALSTRAMRTFVLELNIARKNNELLGDTAELRFEDFIKKACTENFRIKLYQKYPGLKQVLLTFIEQYIATSKELFLRLVQDFSEIKSLFWLKSRKLELIKISRGGDTHRQGRTVSILEFNSGNKKYYVVYKPRCIEIDLAYQNFIIWLNKKTKIKLHTTKALARKGYGWFEYVSHTVSCQFEVQVKRYYRRLGYLLGVMHLLSGTDIHIENVIAHGEHPIIVDLECLLTPLIGSTQTTEEDLYSRFLVIDTFLLPKQLMADAKYTGFDISAFSGMGGETAPQKFLEPVNPCTDYMTVERKETVLLKKENIPKLNNSSVDPLKYSGDFTNGFIEIYNIFLNNVELLKSETSPMNHFKNKEIRVLIRNTSQYAKLLFESYHPLLLHDKKKRKEYFQWLQPEDDDDSFLHQIINSEYVDLMEENIPIFNSNSTSNKIYDSHGNLVNIHVIKSGFQRVMSFINNNLTQEDLRLQKLCIEQSMAAYVLNQNITNEPIKYQPINFLSKNKSKNIIEIECLRIAQKQLDILMDSCIRDGEFIFWTNIEYTHSNIWKPGRVATDLYNGLSGIALTFAYAEKIFKNRRYGQFAREITIGLLKIVRNIKSIEGLASGGYGGLGSIIYTLYCLYIMWNDKSLLKDIDSLSQLCAKIVVKNSHELDLISGASGYLAVLEACKDAYSYDKFEYYSKICIDNILTNYPVPQEIPKEYPIVSTKPLLGFAHGVAGIVWSLMKYSKKKDNCSIHRWVLNGLNYEREHFCHLSNNWPDFRRSSKTQCEKSVGFITAWCHGATGIGISRLDMVKNGWHDNLIEQEIKLALKNTEENFDEILNLCHGSVGKLEFLLNASKENYISEELCHSHVMAIIDYIDSSEKLTYETVGSVFVPGLFTGAAGVAYQFMRIAYPEFVPSVLLLKPPLNTSVITIPKKITFKKDRQVA